jgi:hypothetical protein
MMLSDFTVLRTRLIITFINRRFFSQRILFNISTTQPFFPYTYMQIINRFNVLAHAGPNLPVTFLGDVEYQVVNSETGT